MDFLRPSLVRHALAVTTIGFALAGLGGACAAQDERGAMSQAAYHGPYLSWAGKKAQAPAPDPDLSEASYAPAPNYDPRGAAPPAARYAAPSDSSESRYGPTASDAQPAPRPAPPAEVYSRPATYARPAPQAAPPAPVPQPAPVQPAPAPQPAAYAAPSSAAPPAEHAQATSTVRFYSLHRAYGITPDPIPESTESHTVLIGPPDNGSAAHDQDQGGDQDQDGVGEDKKAAAHGDGAGDKQSGDN